MVNDATLALVKEYEGLRLAAYTDAAGVVTIGYGTTAAAGLGITPKIGMTITEREAERLLIAGLNKFGASIRPKITAPINENEWGAFLSLAYNIGPGAFAKSSALRKFNAGDKKGAANAILLWNKAGGKVLRGLERRRAAERALFLTPVVAHKPAETAPQAPGQAPHDPADNAKMAGRFILAALALAAASVGAWWADLAEAVKQWLFFWQ